MELNLLSAKDTVKLSKNIKGALLLLVTSITEKSDLLTGAQELYEYVLIVALGEAGGQRCDEERESGPVGVPPRLQVEPC